MKSNSSMESLSDVAASMLDLIVRVAESKGLLPHKLGPALLRITFP